MLASAGLSGAAVAQEPGRVDDAALRQAPATEWLTYGRDYGEQRYSPLEQVHTGNVDQLELAWSWEIEGTPGLLESTPLVSNGVLYATGAWNVVFALDARTGDVRWTWDPAIVRGGPSEGGPDTCCGAINRGVALYGGKVYTGLLDGRLVALDAETGRLVWVRQTTPVGSNYTITGAPRIVKGNVIIGNGGAEYHGVRGYVTAYDAETGEQVWRTYTVPGDPSLPFESPAMEMAAETWEGEWWRYGGGGTAWDSFSFDPEADLLYVGTGNGAPWNHVHRSEGTGDNLFLASILALDPDTGALVWYYQTVPGDTWDYTATMTMILADLEIGGEQRQVLMQAPKNGFFYVLDRRTGELLAADPITEHINWASGVDLETGRPIETPSARYGTGEVWIMPHTGGTHNWHPMSFHPGTGLVYIPGQNGASLHRFEPAWEPSGLGEFSTGTIRDHGRITEPGPEPAPTGFLLAWDPVNREERWRIPYEAHRRNGGTLATAGDLVFSGRIDGWIYAHHAATGEKLWEYPIGRAPASPITYELDGRQYLTILSGAPSGGDTTAGRVWTFVLGGGLP